MLSSSKVDKNFNCPSLLLFLSISLSIYLAHIIRTSYPSRGSFWPHRELVNIYKIPVLPSLFKVSVSPLWCIPTTTVHWLLEIWELFGSQIQKFCVLERILVLYAGWHVVVYVTLKHYREVSPPDGVATSALKTV